MGLDEWRNWRFPISKAILILLESKNETKNKQQAPNANQVLRHK
jgi:hypothetical protein